MGASRMKSDLSDQKDRAARIERAAREPSELHVAIVGAGFAGLRCAAILLRRGVKVTIFEARDRLGGRVAQSSHLGHAVDLGPNWIHGTVDNPILDLAQNTDTQLHPLDEAQAIIGTDGAPMSAAEADEYSTLMWDVVLADAFKYSEHEQDSIDPQRSLYDYFVEKSEGMFRDLDHSKAARKRVTLLQIASMWGAYIGSSVKAQSLRFFWLEETIDGENPFVAGTYQKILQEVVRPVKDGATIKLNCPVVRVRSHDDQRVQRPSITTADDVSAEFDEVVVTTPLGWLKRHQDAFQPSLPPRLSQAIDAVGYGCLDKVYISFPSAFWDQPLPSEQTLSNGTDPDGVVPNVRAPTAPLHQQSSAHQELHYPGFAHWIEPSYADDTNSERWAQQCMNLAALPPDCAHPTLLFYVYGSCSQHIARIVSAAKDDKDRDAQLDKFFRPYYSRLPNYSAADPACTPKALLATAWANDEYAGYGSYCNFQVGVEKGDEDVEVMRHGLPERGVWLAGEHTAPFVALGTSTGAYWSGQRVAERLLKAYGHESGET